VNETPIIRKTKEQRILKELANQEHKVDGLSHIENELDEVKKVKVLDSVKGNFDIQIITPKTVENFLRFLGLVPEAHHNYHLDKNLDKYRIDI
jgi:phage antirepressor YoqD-like protein